MPAPIVGAVAKAVLSDLGKKGAKTALTKAVGESRAKKVSDDVYNARRRAKRAETRFKQAIEFMDNPMAPVTREAKKLAGQFTRQELERIRSGYAATAEMLKSDKGIYSERVLQAAKKENTIAETLRRTKGLSARDKAAWERLQKSPSTSKVAWSFVNKELQRMEGTLGRRATIEDLRRIGHSEDVEQAIRNIFAERFEMTLEDAEYFDSINMGIEELYELLQYSIATGKPPSAKMYREMVRSGWYKTPRGKRQKRRKGKK